MHYYSKFVSGSKDMLCAIDEDGNLKGLWFDGQKYYPDIEEGAVWIKTGFVNDAVSDTLEKLQIQLDLYFQGKLQNFDIPLKPAGSVFRKRVWNLLSEIPFGNTATYGELSKKVAAEGGLERMSAQAVGGAVGHNPISIIIPCHRVLGANGSLTGYAGGIELKKELLSLETK